MTREEALKTWLPVIKMGVESMPECSEALDMAIEALEQEPCTDADVLNEIRSEIVHLHDWAFSREEILRIIDKYRESEE